jgi:hypothetical protein
MALSRRRKSDLIILAADILKRIPADNLIREAGATAARETFPTMSPEETRFVEELLDNTIAFTGRDTRTGELCVGPR